MLNEIKEIKLKKLENLRSAGMETYPEKTKRSMENREALDKFEALQEKELNLTRRVRSLRPMGGSAFAHIEDESAKIQIFLNEQYMSGGKHKLFIDNVDLGDFVEVRGKLFKTKTGEMTLQISDWKMLSKSLAPVPTEYFGLKDTEELLRRRYLDLMMNPETREIFKKKNIFWQTVRNFLVKEEFLEVQTPVLEHTPGGADAEPFVTHHDALDQDFYLRISLELPLKRLLVGGFEKVFEIGKVFRNEGIDTEHLQDYDMCEFYWAYADYNKLMDFTQEMYQTLVKDVTHAPESLRDTVRGTAGGLKTTYQGQIIDWSGKWPREDYFALIKKHSGVDLSGITNVKE